MPKNSYHLALSLPFETCRDQSAACSFSFACNPPMTSNDCSVVGLDKSAFHHKVLLSPFPSGLIFSVVMVLSILGAVFYGVGRTCRDRGSVIVATVDGLDIELP